MKVQISHFVALVMGVMLAMGFSQQAKHREVLAEVNAINAEIRATNRAMRVELEAMVSPVESGWTALTPIAGNGVQEIIDATNELEAAMRLAIEATQRDATLDRMVESGNWTTTFPTPQMERIRLANGTYRNVPYCFPQRGYLREYLPTITVMDIGNSDLIAGRVLDAVWLEGVGIVPGRPTTAVAGITSIVSGVPTWGVSDISTTDVNWSVVEDGAEGSVYMSDGEGFVSVIASDE